MEDVEVDLEALRQWIRSAVLENSEVKQRQANIAQIEEWVHQRDKALTRSRFLFSSVFEWVYQSVASSVPALNLFALIIKCHPTCCSWWFMLWEERQTKSGKVKGCSSSYCSSKFVWLEKLKLKSKIFFGFEPLPLNHHMLVMVL